MFFRQHINNITAADDLSSSADNAFPSSPNQRQMAIKDLNEGLQKWRLWLTLSYHDIRLRYRRSVLGPLWLTISIAISLYSMGYLYSSLFHQELHAYYPYLVSGMLGWTLISTLVMEYTDGFISYQSLIYQLKLPYTLHIHRIAARNMIVFFHNLLILIPIYILFHDTAKINTCTLLLIPGLCVIYINAISFGTVLALIGARYRDMSQFIKSIIQVIFFITPVMWKPDMLTGKKHLIVDWNPFYSILEMIRAPLLGEVPNFDNVRTSLVITLVGFIMWYSLFIRYRSRIVYWL
ncbi:MAG: ABC transporter permease [Legionellaceae bacterium]|nr:ABC transporter permease [Legionellaceae bacterium]MBP9774383.1 ABC transporter permease [Legionellaceae bacterium]